VARLRRIFLDFSLAPLEVFKGVKFIHITLSLAAFTTVCKCTTHGRGSSTSLLLILFLTGEDGRQGEDKPRPYNGRRSGSRRPSIAGATPVVARCPSTCKSHSARWQKCCWMLHYIRNGDPAMVLKEEDCWDLTQDVGW